jgi:hypothetical protein
MYLVSLITICLLLSGISHTYVYCASILDQSLPSVLDCNERALTYVPPGYEEASCTESELRSDNPIKQCCEQSNNAYLCTTCGSCAGENTAGNLASPGNGTLRYKEDGEPDTCDGNDEAECCKVGNGNEPQKYACFETIEIDDTEPPVNNDDVSLLFGFRDRSILHSLGVHLLTMYILCI